MSNKTSGFKRAIGIVLGVITMLVLIALFVVLVMAPIPNIWVDKVAASYRIGRYRHVRRQRLPGHCRQSEHTSALCGVRLRLQRHCLGDRAKVQFR